jgi:hypothetical protein
MINPMQIDLNNLFSSTHSRNIESAQFTILGLSRIHFDVFKDAACIIDSFSESGEVCCFLRLPPGEQRTARFVLEGQYSIKACMAGGWLLIPAEHELPSYWSPLPFMLRALDSHGRILKSRTAEIIGFDATAQRLEVTATIPDGMSLDWVVWRFPVESVLVAELEQLLVLETQAYFTWSSHTLYQKPSDLYAHLLHGHVYENQAVWPRYWTICSELDAYSLYVTLHGLGMATGKRLYELLQSQIVLSVIARQDENGGWSHGEWTDGMESHYRLCAGALHLLAADYEKDKDATVRQSMDKAAAFLASRIDCLDQGVWFMHDSLETSLHTLKASPFRWVYSRALGKSPCNLLVLNTHLDTTLALDRYREVSGDERYADLIGSAHASTQAVLELRPAEWMYKLLFRAIGLTLLPTPVASLLPLPVRALKRFAWKHLIPWLPRIKAHFPRFVVPGGYIERDLSQCSFADQYQSVTLMDLVRYVRRFPCVELPDFTESLTFTHASGLRERWKESRDKDHAIGFWTEALHHLCMLRPEQVYRHWLVAAVLDAESLGIGLSPSVLGTHPEIAANSGCMPCPSPSHAVLRVINLGRRGRPELLVINPSNYELPLMWETEGGEALEGLIWHCLENDHITPVAQPLQIPPRAGLWGRPQTDIKQD